MTTTLEAAFLTTCRMLELPEPLQEYRFCPSRLWRFDFCWMDAMIAVEMEGGVWSRGGHNRPQKFTANCEKYNAAALLGYTVLRFSREMVDNGMMYATMETIRERLTVTQGAYGH